MLNKLRESGIFLCLLAIGIFTTMGSKAGFVGVENTVSPTRLKHYSLWMLLLTCAAVAASFGFRGRLMFSAALPLICLSVANQLFKKRLLRLHDAHVRMVRAG
jgi:glucose-6-phosphate-specific signal transduction histidine kinase